MPKYNIIPEDIILQLLLKLEEHSYRMLHGTMLQKTSIIDTTMKASQKTVLLELYGETQ
jgi:hypothetical protein